MEICFQAFSGLPMWEMAVVHSSWIVQNVSFYPAIARKNHLSFIKHVLLWGFFGVCCWFYFLILCLELCFMGLILVSWYMWKNRVVSCLLEFGSHIQGEGRGCHPVQQWHGLKLWERWWMDRGVPVTGELSWKPLNSSGVALLRQTKGDVDWNHMYPWQNKRKTCLKGRWNQMGRFGLTHI